MSGLFFPRFARIAALAVALLVVAGGPAAAQSAGQVPAGSGFTVENGTECAPNSDVAIFFSTPAREARQIGSTITDGTGHFAVQVALPADVALGIGTVTVECGIEGAVLLYDIEVIAATELDLMQYAPYALGAIGVVALVGVVVARRKGRSDDEAEAAPDATADVEEAVEVAPVAAEEPGDSDDDPDYWVWDANTERGPVKRLACLSADHFFLHEVPADAFPAFLEHLAAVGPETALERAFFKVAVDDIDEVRHRGTEMRVTHRGPDGFVARTIDLATEVDDVMTLLSRRVPVMAAGAPVPAG